MRPRGYLPTPAVFSRRLLSLVVRSAVITSMSFAVAFGFLSGATSPGAHYDPHTFAIGVSALFGAACGAIGILISRIRQMKRELRDMEGRLDEAADRHWEISEAQERTQSFFEMQGDVIVRRDGAGAITYVNDAFCVLAGRAREELLATAFVLAVEEQGETTLLADGTATGSGQVTTTTPGGPFTFQVQAVGWVAVSPTTYGILTVASFGGSDCVVLPVGVAKPGPAHHTLTGNCSDPAVFVGTYGKVTPTS